MEEANINEETRFRNLDEDGNDNLARRDLSRDLPEWLEKFAENLGD